MAAIQARWRELDPEHGNPDSARMQAAAEALGERAEARRLKLEEEARAAAKHAEDLARRATLCQAVEDLAAALKRRFDALRAVLAEPAPHAARMTALLAAHGLRLRAPKPLIPAAVVWTLAHIHAPVRALAHASAHPDTS